MWPSATTCDRARTLLPPTVSLRKLKKTLAHEYPNDIDAYIDGKTGFILETLVKTDLTDDELDSITAANRKV